VIAVSSARLSGRCPLCSLVKSAQILLPKWKLPSVFLDYFVSLPPSTQEYFGLHWVMASLVYFLAENSTFFEGKEGGIA